jgi:hypothetical protein
VAEPSEFNDPIIMSPSATPVNPKLPVVASAPLCAATVAEVNAAVPKLTAVSFGLVLLVPTWRVPTVARPLLLIVVEAIVPSVFVPVEDVKPVAKVETPRMLGIVAVLIVAVEIVAVLIVAVPIVAVPVVAEMLELNVATPVTPRLEDNVTAPVTARLEDNVVAPAALSVPVDLTPALESSSALIVLSPSVTACRVASIPPKPSVFSSCV